MNKTIFRLKYSKNLGFLKPSERSYWGNKLDIKLIDVNDFREIGNPTETQLRMLENELSGVEPVKYVINLSLINIDSGGLTVQQTTEILNDMGFNVYPKLSGSKDSDFTALMNVKGFVLPFWDKLPDLFPVELEKLFLTKFSPGKERLHIRIYNNNDGNWYITAHTDYNWINPNLIKVFKAHFTHGAGNYEMGTALMVRLLNKFNEHINKDEAISAEEIIYIAKEMYRNGPRSFYNNMGILLIL